MKNLLCDFQISFVKNSEVVVKLINCATNAISLVEPHYPKKSKKKKKEGEKGDGIIKVMKTEFKTKNGNDPNENFKP